MSRYSVKQAISALSLAALTMVSPVRGATAASDIDTVAPKLTSVQEEQVRKIQLLSLSATAAVEWVQRKNNCEQALKEVKFGNNLDVSGELPPGMDVEAEQVIMDSLGALTEVEEYCAARPDVASLPDLAGQPTPQ